MEPIFDVDSILNTAPSEGFKPSEGSEIKIYITLSEYVMTIPDVPHLAEVAHLIRIDISHLPIGIYFIQIGNYTEHLIVVR